MTRLSQWADPVGTIWAQIGAVRAVTTLHGPAGESDPVPPP